MTPAWTRTRSAPMSMIRLRRLVLNTTSPRGVAPPVSDDCAPIGSTAVDECRTSAISASVDGATSADALSGDMGRVFDDRSQAIGIGDAHRRVRRAARAPRLDAVVGHRVIVDGMVQGSRFKVLVLVLVLGFRVLATFVGSAPRFEAQVLAASSRY